jgi:small subunit ribosomal protein S16
MSVKIRLKKASDTAKKRFHFRIIVCTHTKARDGRSLDELGFYNPSKNPPSVKINREKLDFWLKRGATASDTLKSLLKKEIK